MGRTVIKAGARVEAPARGMYSVDLRDIAMEASEALAAAKEEAAETVRNAVRQAEADRKAAREQGFEEGRRAGFDAGRKAGYEAALAEARTRFASEQEELVGQMSAMLRGFGERREQLYLAARRDVVVLAIAIASRVAEKLAETAEQASAMAVQATEEALDLIGMATEVSVRVHPAAWESVKRFAGLSDETAGGSVGGLRAVTDALTRSRHISIMEDATIEPGGAVVETAECEVDARLRERVERVADELVAGWRRRIAELM